MQLQHREIYVSIYDNCLICSGSFFQNAKKKLATPDGASVRVPFSTFAQHDVFKTRAGVAGTC